MSLPEWFLELARDVSNKGRWGDDDEIGTMNLITREATLRGVACARTGRSFSLALPLHHDGPQTGRIPNRVNPIHAMIGINTPFMGDPQKTCLSDDVLTMGTQSATHWDGLAHASYGGQLYNGHSSATVIAEAGATKCGIEKVKTIVTRGILLDVAATLGVRRLEAGYAIQPGDLDAAVERAGIAVCPGDILLVRTGQQEHLFAGDKDAYRVPAPGLSCKTVKWFRERDVAAVATDTFAFEVWPGEDDEVLLPVHLLQLVEMGMMQGQHWFLDELAEDCARDGVHEFLLHASPEPIVGGTGSPVNPIATK